MRRKGPPGSGKGKAYFYGEGWRISDTGMVPIPFQVGKVEPSWKPSAAIPAPRARPKPSLWGIYAEKTAAFRGFGRAGCTSIEIERGRGERPLELFARSVCGVERPHPATEAVRLIRACEYLIVWACQCPESTLYALPRGEFPARAGHYGVCPLCGAVALSIVDVGQEDADRPA